MHNYLCDACEDRLGHSWYTYACPSCRSVRKLGNVSSDDIHSHRLCQLCDAAYKLFETPPHEVSVNHVAPADVVDISNICWLNLFDTPREIRRKRREAGKKRLIEDGLIPKPRVYQHEPAHVITTKVVNKEPEEIKIDLSGMEI